MTGRVLKLRRSEHSRPIRSYILPITPVPSAILPVGQCASHSFYSAAVKVAVCPLGISLSLIWVSSPLDLDWNATSNAFRDHLMQGMREFLNLEKPQTFKCATFGGLMAWLHSPFPLKLF